MDVPDVGDRHRMGHGRAEDHVLVGSVRNVRVYRDVVLQPERDALRACAPGDAEAAGGEPADDAESGGVRDELCRRQGRVRGWGEAECVDDHAGEGLSLILDRAEKWPRHVRHSLRGFIRRGVHFACARGLDRTVGGVVTHAVGACA